METEKEERKGKGTDDKENKESDDQEIKKEIETESEEEGKNKRKRKGSCQMCLPCITPPCGNCIYCIDRMKVKPTKKQRCLERRCIALGFIKYKKVIRRQHVLLYDKKKRQKLDVKIKTESIEIETDEEKLDMTETNVIKTEPIDIDEDNERKEKEEMKKKRETNKKNLTCQVCKRVFIYNTSFNKHKHIEKEHPSILKKDRYNHLIDTSTRRSDRLNTIEKDQGVIKKKKMFKTLYVNEKSKTVKKFDLNKKRETNKKNLTCQVCKRVFIYNTSFNKHKHIEKEHPSILKKDRYNHLIDTSTRRSDRLNTIEKDQGVIKKKKMFKTLYVNEKSKTVKKFDLNKIAKYLGGKWQTSIIKTKGVI